MTGTTQETTAASAGDVHDCCVTGYAWTGTPKGKDGKLGGVDTYFTTPGSDDPLVPSPTITKAILIIHDVFGYTSPNTRLVADRLAEEGGFLVIIPDFFEGNGLANSHPSMLQNFDKMLTASSTWQKITSGVSASAGLPAMAMLVRNYNDAKVLPVMDSVLQDLRDRFKIESSAVGTLGYCWGGRFVVKLAGSVDGATPKVRCFVATHPSKIEVPKDVEVVATPSLFLCADKDPVFPASARQAAENILKAKMEANPALPTEFVMYPNLMHGFAVRGNSGDPTVVEAANDTVKRMLTFFKSHLRESNVQIENAVKIE
ncbi:hypothetical protein HK102_009051 [Quaeritorhiza haematococci]|nr:hypothetical protein HK102_009051 [Quaeritorhiza haematococci]